MLTLLEHTGTRALSVDAGEIVAVLGAPGCGKSRLALELAFLLQPLEGETLFRGATLPRKGFLKVSRRPRQVTMLVQNAEDQLFARTVFDDVAFGPRHLLLPDEEIERRVVGALEAVRLDIASVRDRSPFALSGGERRRVALAGVLAMEPDVLILDEPTANLDARTRSQFLELLAPLRHKAAIVWFTARAREAATADRVYLLQGNATREVPAGEGLLVEWRSLLAAGIELPGTYELAGALEAGGVALPVHISAAELQGAIVHAWQERHLAR